MRIKPVKIVATIGPASHTEQAILELAKAGVDVFRINFSHATREEAIDRIAWIRNAEKALGRPLTVMGDLPGPKIRISDIKLDTILQKGQKFIVSKDIQVGDANGCGVNQPTVLDDLEVGADIFIDDGTIKLTVDKKIENGVEATVIVGGLLKPRKGFSAEGLSLKLNDVTEQDKKAIALLIEQGADAIAVSFVQSAKEIQDVRELLPSDSRIMLIAKMETAKCVQNAEEIVEEADGIMVARGDLGLSIPIAKVPLIQKKLIDLCVRKAKPVITATQMLESMISKPIPTRAEVADVANAILDRTDAIMLSAETAEGKFPAETVEMMVKIIAEVAGDVSVYEYKERKTVSNAITDSVGTIGDLIDGKLIIAFTESGRTARRISRHRHQLPIIAISPDDATIRRLNFSWGVYPQKVAVIRNFEEMLTQAKGVAKNNKIEPLIEGDKFVISAGMPFGETGTTNMILVQKI